MVEPLIEFLRAEEARGVSHVFLDEEARQALREIHARSKRPAVSARSSADQAPPTAGPTRSSVPSSPLTAPVKLAEPHLSAPATGTAAAQIEELKSRAENWAPARSLGTLRTTMVFSTGNPEADLMLVGEAPGYQEERQKEPFVGPAGQKLDDILRAMGLARESVYISNIVKFRPSTPGQTTNNRPPDDDEIASCLPCIRQETAIVRPKCIIALGGTAAKGLLGREEAVARLRGTWHEFEGVPVRVTYHPSYLLRSTSGNADRRKVWEDMLAAMEFLGMPISDKQRGYFLK